MRNINIDKLEDVRAGDTVTLAFDGHEYTGVAYHRFGDPRLSVGATALDVDRGRPAITSGPYAFIRALGQREELPTKPGSVIVNATIRGVPGRVAILDEDGEWFTPAPGALAFHWHDPDLITSFELGKIVPA